MKRITLILLSLLFVSISYAQRTSYSIKTVLFQAHIDASAVFTTKYIAGNYERLSLAGPGLDATIGARITKYSYLGVGMGYHTLMTKAMIGVPSGSQWHLPPASRAVEDVENYVYTDVFDYNHYLPLFINCKIYWPVSHKVHPFVDLSLGGFIGFNERVYYELNNYTYNYKANRLANGFYMRTGLGLDVMRVNLGIGYEFLKNRVGSEHIGYVKLGWRFG